MCTNSSDVDMQNDDRQKQTFKSGIASSRNSSSGAKISCKRNTRSGLHRARRHPYWSQTLVCHLIIDNTSALYSIKKGRSKSYRVNEAIAELFSKNVRILTVRYIASKWNCSDWLSRLYEEEPTASHTHCPNDSSYVTAWAETEGEKRRAAENYSEPYCLWDPKWLLTTMLGLCLNCCDCSWQCDESPSAPWTKEGKRRGDDDRFLLKFCPGPQGWKRVYKKRKQKEGTRSQSTQSPKTPCTTHAHHFSLILFLLFYLSSYLFSYLFSFFLPLLFVYLVFLIRH